MAHEYAHAATAYSQGDDTAYRLGRMTLNPVPHIDPFMTIIMPAVTFWFGFVFGGAKPVPVDPRKFRNYRKGDILVSSAGVVTNFVLIFVFALIFVVLGLLGRSFPDAVGVLNSAQRMAMWGIIINVILCFFNLLPIPPLDGSKLFYYLLPPLWGQKYRELDRFGFLIVLAFVALPPLRAVLFWLMTPALMLLQAVHSGIAPYALGDGWRVFG